MRIISRGTLRDFWAGHADAEQPLRAWFTEVQASHWEKPQDVKDVYGNASVKGDNSIVFNIAGNKYRLVVKFNHPFRVGYIRFIGTHADYDAVDAESV